jgi:hypothetical protein
MLRIVTTPPDGRVQSAATYRPMYAELNDRDPFVYETPCFQWVQFGRGLESLVGQPSPAIPEPKPKTKGIMSWIGAHVASRVAMSRRKELL